ncbi:hypothetical protein DES40_0814 [Litorimonas taeanensis]|uniref:Uncharacterized protein n=1 Tax=Litorimonas taeanensis TaxID=568099 RepID=A0A420WKP9_9PROT|nr:hypothetical protein [Litorimonas taeanensis]RKQ71492.1 hypothetical protein DES40_0814 [Litorimonas taeanensis]
MDENTPQSELELQIQAVRVEAEKRDSEPYKIRRKSKAPSQLLNGLVRFSLLGAVVMMGYISLHYIPAYFNPSKYLNANKQYVSSKRLDTNESGALVGHYLDVTSVKKTYLRQGQALRVQYLRPDNSNIELRIKRCRSVFLIEVFKCEVVGEKVVQITEGQNGTQRFIFEDKGFYMLEERVSGQTNSKDFRVVWSRV